MKDRISKISKANPKMGIKKGDLVVVISGKYKGVKGRVLKAFPAEETVVVEKVNFIKRHTRPNRTNPQGGIIEKEAPINVSNVMIFNDKIGPDGKRIRVCAKTGDEL
jgi:large subunit ribosomal protein L24